MDARYFFSLVLTSVICAGFIAPAEAGKVSVKLRGSDEANSAIVEEVQLYENSHALVIGNDEYTGGWPRLSMAVEDAKAVAAALEDQEFDVTLKLNLDSRQLRDALEEFYLVKGEDPEARLFVWFAGHGHSSNGEGFLIPTDAPKPSAGSKFFRKALPLRRIGEYVRLAEAKHAFAVFDSCFSGTVFESARALPPAAVTRATVLPVRQFLTSGDAGQTVSDNGSFRELFIRALQGEERADANRDGYVTASEMGLFMTDRVTNLTESRQTPRYGKLRDRDWDRGDFVFTLQTPKQSLAMQQVQPGASQGATAGGSEVARIQQESIFWQSIENNGNAGSYNAYLQAFPNGIFAPLAKVKLAELQSKQNTQQRSLTETRRRDSAAAQQAREQREKLKAELETQRRKLAQERERIAAETERLKAEAEAAHARLAASAKDGVDVARLRQTPGKDGNYDGKWQGRMVCDQGSSDERSENVSINVKNNRFDEMPGLTNFAGELSGTIYAAGNIEVKGHVDFEQHPGLMVPAKLLFTGAFNDGSLVFGGDHGSSVCQVTMQPTSDKG